MTVQYDARAEHLEALLKEREVHRTIGLPEMVDKIHKLAQSGEEAVIILLTRYKYVDQVAGALNQADVKNIQREHAGWRVWFNEHGWPNIFIRFVTPAQRSIRQLRASDCPVVRCTELF